MKVYQRLANRPVRGSTRRELLSINTDAPLSPLIRRLLTCIRGYIVPNPYASFSFSDCRLRYIVSPYTILFNMRRIELLVSKDRGLVGGSISERNYSKFMFARKRCSIIAMFVLARWRKRIDEYALTLFA